MVYVKILLFRINAACGYFLRTLGKEETATPRAIVEVNPCFANWIIGNLLHIAAG